MRGVRPCPARAILEQAVDVSALEGGFSAQANWAPCAGRRLEHERAVETHYGLLLCAAPSEGSELPELNQLCSGLASNSLRWSRA